MENRIQIVRFILHYCFLFFFFFTAVVVVKVLIHVF